MQEQAPEVGAEPGGASTASRARAAELMPEQHRAGAVDDDVRGLAAVAAAKAVEAVDRAMLVDVVGERLVAEIRGALVSWITR